MNAALVIMGVILLAVAIIVLTFRAIEEFKAKTNTQSMISTIARIRVL